MKKILIIGCGSLGYSIVQIFKSKKKKILVVENNKSNFDLLKKESGKYFSVFRNLKEIKWDDIKYLMICVKPKDTHHLLNILKDYINKSTTIISFVAGIKLKTIKTNLGLKNRVIRFMPNLSIKYGQSITAVYSNNIVSKEKIKISDYFGFFGTIVWLKKEEDIDFFTAFFGGGPAYISLILEHLHNILKKRKIKEIDSNILVLKLLENTLNYIKKEKISFLGLIKRVASKGGTTQQGLDFLKKRSQLNLLLSTAIKKAELQSVKMSKKKD